MRRTLVIGMGKSGRAAAELLLAKGEQVVGVDKSAPLFREAPLQELAHKGVELVLDDTPLDVSSFSQVILSPGVAPSHPLSQAAHVEGIEVIGEVELALRECRQPLIGITGTNGKTTVTLLTAHALNSSGLKARALGNVGDPLSSYFVHPDLAEILVVELSSYQLETLHQRAFDVGILLNITPDHLDRYPSMHEYAKAKCHLQHCLKRGAEFYVYEDVEKEFGALLSSHSYKTFGLREKIEYILPVSYAQQGEHEKLNSLAAWLLCRRWGVQKEQFSFALSSFSKPAHRIEFVAEINGVAYYDDSKGTNVDAVIQAVRAMRGPVILIAGGVDKGASYLVWKEHFKGKVKQIFTLGQAADKICSELKDSFPVVTVATLKEAVSRAKECAVSGECVLLSPGCSSFDMFRDYADRGEQFKQLVR